MSSFIIVTPNNFQNVQERLLGKEGRILIIEPGYQSYSGSIVDARLELYDHPLIIEGERLYTARNTRKIHNRSWQTGWQRDREYLLRKNRVSSDPLVNFCSSLFARLIVGPYEFSIGFQSTACRSLFGEKGMVLFVPRRKKIEAAFRHGLDFILGQIKRENGFSFSVSEIDNILAYIMEDLSTGKNFQQNVRVGLETDEIMGMA